MLWCVGTKDEEGDVKKGGGERKCVFVSLRDMQQMTIAHAFETTSPKIVTLKGHNGLKSWNFSWRER